MRKYEPVISYTALHVTNGTHLQTRADTFSPDLAKKLSGADRVAVAAYALRRQGHPEGPRLADTHEMARDAAFIVHCDFTDLLKDQLLQMYDHGRLSIASDTIANGGMGLTKDELRKGRIAILNFWRPIGRGPCLRNPLAVLDPTSMEEEDVVLCEHPLKETNATFLKSYKLPGVSRYF